MRTIGRKAGDRAMKPVMLIVAASVLLGVGCQPRPPRQTEKTVMQLDMSYQSDSSVVVVRPGESIRLGESREELKADAQMMGTDIGGKAAPSKEITNVQKGDSVRLGESPAGKPDPAAADPSSRTPR